MKRLGEILELLRSTPGLRLAVVFGSTARSEERPDDLDVGVLFEAGADPDLAFEGRLARAAGRAVDLVRLDEAPPLLRFEIARDGRVLHAASEEDWIDFKARAMIDWWDFQPTLAVYHEAARERRRAERGDGPS